MTSFPVKTLILAVLTWGAIAVASAPNDTIGTEHLMSDTLKAVVRGAATDIVSLADGGEKAKEACRVAFDLRNVELLSAAFSNPSPIVGDYCVSLLNELDTDVSARVLIVALGRDEIWNRPEKVGELIALDRHFKERVVNLLSKLLGSRVGRVKLAHKDARQQLADALLKAFPQRSRE